MKKHKDVDKILISPARIRERVKAVARAIRRDYAGKHPVLVAVLKGGVVFLSDLIRELDLPCTVDFMAVSSYGAGAKSSGVVRVIMDLKTNPEGRDLLLVEDILDTGLTLRYLLDNLSTRKPRSLRTCVFLDKTDNRKVPAKADYSCFKIPNAFVVGYGLDYAEKYRNLPYVGVLRKEIYQSNANGERGPRK